VCDWEYLRDLIRRCWKESTGLANWAVIEFVKADVVRTAQMNRLPPMPRVNLYHEARARFPQLHCQTVDSILRYVEQNYRRLRLRILWFCDASLPVYHFPAPYPIRNQAWTARFDANGKPLLNVPLMDERVTLMLRDGQGYRPQLVAFKRIVDGQAIRGELSLFRQRASTGDHRPGFSDRSPAGGARTPFRMMAKLVAWLPRETPVDRTRDGVLTARTCEDAFLVVEGTGLSRPWRLHADHVRRWYAEHRNRLQRLRIDQKVELGPPTRIQLSEKRVAVVDKHRRRIQTWCHQASAMLVKLAERHRVSEVHLDDSNRAYMPEFPWHLFVQCLCFKLDERRIQFANTTSLSDTPTA
jgi:hypothetical protein